MGFGRAENATPLGEAVSLAAFDANVPEVLENLRAARQSRNSREVRYREGGIHALNDKDDPGVLLHTHISSA